MDRMGDMAISALDILSTLFVSAIGLVFIILIVMLVIDLSQTPRPGVHRGFGGQFCKRPERAPEVQLAEPLAHGSYLCCMPIGWQR